MTRRAAKVSLIEVKRLISAVQACGLPIVRVTFDGNRVDVVTAGDKSSNAPAPKPERFETWEEYNAWRDTQRETRD